MIYLSAAGLLSFACTPVVGRAAQIALAPNAAVNVQFVLGVQASGRFRFLVNVEALPGTQGAALTKGIISAKH